MTGCVAQRKGVYYVRLVYYDKNHYRKEKWISTGLSGRGAKQKATAMIDSMIEKYSYLEKSEHPAKMADYLKMWKELQMDEVAETTFDGLCQLESGTIVSIGWDENLETGERLTNHYTYSLDNGKTFSSPISTGVLGQASSVCAIGKERLLALHAVRRDTERPGIYGYVIDFSDRTWRVVDEALIWEPTSPMKKDERMAEIFSFIKFGQPGAILLSDGNVLMSHWFADAGEYKTVATRIKLSGDCEI